MIPPEKSHLQTWAPFLIVVAGLAVYANSFSGPFIFDDIPAISDNPHVRHLWPIWEAMSAPKESTLEARPLVALSFAVNSALGGLNVWGYHATNMAIHLAAALALYGIVRRTFLSRQGKLESLPHGNENSAGAIALSAALLWLAHPLQTESVTYLVQRVEAMMGLFYLLTLYCAIRSFGTDVGRDSSPDVGSGEPTYGVLNSSNRLFWQAASLTACACGMASKEVMGTAPIMIFLYDRIFVSKSARDILRNRWGFYAGLAMTWMILIGLIAASPRHSSISALGGTSSTGSGEYNLLQSAPILYALTECRVVFHYLRLCLWPMRLVLDYGWPRAGSLAEAWPFVAGIGGLLAASCFMLRKKPLLGFWAIWFFLILAPTSSFLPLDDPAFEHRLYLPLAAVAVCFATGGDRLIAGLFGKTDKGFFAATTTLLLVAMVLGLLTIRRNEDYRTHSAIYADTAAKRPNNPRARHNFEAALQDEGIVNDTAIANCREALRLNPNQPKVQAKLGLLLTKQGNYAEALRLLSQALESGRDLSDFSDGIETIHNGMGIALSETGRATEAVSHYEEALRINPNYAVAYDNLGQELMKLGRDAEAAEHFATALRIAPDSPEACASLGLALARQGKTEEAVAQLKSRLRDQAPYADAYNTLGIIFAEKNRMEEAMEAFSKAVALDPHHLEAARNLEKAKNSHREHRDRRE